MGQQAYSDSQRTTIVNAEDVATHQKHPRYYCLNPECPAYMYLVLGKIMRPHFRALISQGHLEDCKEYDKREKIEFTWQDAIFNLTIAAPISDNDTSQEKKAYTPHSPLREDNAQSQATRFPRNLSSMYKQLSQISPQTELFGQRVCEIFCSKRTRFFYTQGIYGLKIVEAFLLPKHMFYNALSKQIRLQSYAAKNEIRDIVLSFSDPSLYVEVQNLIWNNQKALFVVAGEFSSSWSEDGSWGNATGRFFQVEIKNLQQFIMITKNYVPHVGGVLKT